MANRSQKPTQNISYKRPDITKNTNGTSTINLYGKPAYTTRENETPFLTFQNTGYVGSSNYTLFYPADAKISFPSWTAISALGLEELLHRCKHDGAIVYLFINIYAKLSKEGACTLTINELSELTRLSSTSVCKCITNLEANGYIEKVDNYSVGNTTRNAYFIVRDLKAESNALLNFLRGK